MFKKQALGQIVAQKGHWLAAELLRELCASRILAKVVQAGKWDEPEHLTEAVDDKVLSFNRIMRTRAND